MSDRVEKALALWGMEGASHTLAAARENRVHRVAHQGGTYALRLHREGYRTDAELLSELRWVEEAGRQGMPVPRPVASASGDLLRTVDGVQADMLTWLPGRGLGAVLAGMPDDGRARLFRDIGREMARLHQVSDEWDPPGGFIRQAWDREGLLGERPAWNRFWENPALSPGQRRLLSDARRAADAELAAIEDSLDYGLIHADIIRENTLVDGGRVRLIDFDDGGPGFRLFEVATLLFAFRDDPGHAALRAATLDGYRSVRPLDDGALELFILLRSLTYVGWTMTRMDIEGVAERNGRAIRAATRLAEERLGAGG